MVSKFIFPRSIEAKIRTILAKKDPVVILVYGPRQAGKTTLVQTLIPENSTDALFLFGDNLDTQKELSVHEESALRHIIGEKTLMSIDEAQRIENIGLSLKIMVDQLHVVVIATGSASFELGQKISEPLTGRTQTFLLYPLSWQELIEHYRTQSSERVLEEMLRFGMYPKVHTLESHEEKETYLREYIDTYLYKDLLMYQNIRKPKVVIDLLTLLAFQIGKPVSLHELARQLSISTKTVEAYLDALEKMFILINIRGLSRNMRKEIRKISKYYFVDVGIRNALIRNFHSLNVRSDKGELFENWFIVERIKRAHNTRRYANFYFWRTYDQKEIDLIEEYGGELHGFECTWSSTTRKKIPYEWMESYHNTSFEVVHSGNFPTFLE